MQEESPPSLSLGGIVQLGNTLISTSGGSVIIYKEMNLEDGRERQIFPSSPIRLLIPIDDPLGVNVREKSFLLALSSHQLALFRLKKKKKFQPVTIDLEEIVDIGTVTVFTMERMQKKKEEVFRVRLKVPILYRSGEFKIEKVTVDYSDNGGVKKSLKTIKEIEEEGGRMKFCVQLSDSSLFGIFEDLVVNSDGSAFRAGKVSQKKKRIISVIGRELWNGKVLVATENGRIRVMTLNDEEKGKKYDRPPTSCGQSSPQCTVRCREPTMIISTKTIAIVGTRRGEIYCLNENLQLMSKLDTEGGPINCLKMDESDGNFLWVGYENGNVKRINLRAPNENESRMEEDNSEPRECLEDIVMDIEEGGNELNESQSNTKKSTKKVSRVSKRSDTPMNCPECEYRTSSVSAWLMHLHRSHNTNADLAGCYLLCECGHKSRSAQHSQECKIANFNVVRIKDGPINTWNDEKTTPKCILCEMYPKTGSGYAQHLIFQHKTTLRDEGISLICSCGYELRSAYVNHKIKTCNGRQYTLHTINKK